MPHWPLLIIIFFYQMLRSEVLFLLENISKSLQNEAIGIMFQERGAPHAIFALYSSQMLEAFEMLAI